MTEAIDRQVGIQNYGPHRRPMFALGAPALVLQLGYWKKHNGDSDDRLTWGEHVDRFVLAVLKRIADQPGIGAFTALHHEKPSYMDAFTGRFENWPTGAGADALRPDLLRYVPIEPEVHTPAHFDVILFEFLAFGDVFKVTVMAERRHEYWTLAVYLSLAGNLPADLEPALASCTPRQKAFLCRLSDLWRRVCFADQPLRNTSELPSDVLSGARKYCVDRYEKFVRNLLGLDEPGLYPNLPQIGAPFSRFLGTLFRWPPSRKIVRAVPDFSPVGQSDNPRHFLKTRYADSGIPLKRVWSLIENLQGRDRRQSYMNGIDIVACYFLDRRAIYASSLARPAAHSLTPDVPRVVFNVFCASDDPWQIGRLADRIACCGCARLGALREFEDVKSAGDKIRSLENLLPLMPDSATLREKLRELRCEPIEYRIERSKHYWNQFQTLLKGLRIHRIEGWQTYDQFVDRRIGGSIDLIDGIGRRYERLRAQADLLYQIEQSDAAKEHLHRLVRLQKFAERVAIIPVAYYLSHWLEGMHGDHRWIYATGAAVAVGLYALYKSITDWREREPKADESESDR